MKRPEYVAVVTGIYARAIREGREPTAGGAGAAALRPSPGTASRTATFWGRRGRRCSAPVRTRQEPRELFAQARATYESGENRKEPVRMYAMLRRGEPAQVAVQDAQEHLASVDRPGAGGGGERPPDP